MTALMLRSWSLLVAVAPGLWPMIALRSRRLVALRGLWPVPPMMTRALDPSPKTRRPGILFLYRAGLRALPGREW